ncbi:MAG: sarcosine oxidase subunit gamma [Pikeienuella sp.]
MDKLIATTPLGGFSATFSGTALAEVTDLALVSLACPLGGEAALDTALADGLSLSRPAAGGSIQKDGQRLIWTTPDQMLLAFEHDGPDAAAVIAGKLGEAAYLTDQTDNWCALSLNGPLARAALERICPVDLHPDAFAENAAARTVMEHMGAIIVRTGPDEFLLLSASSSAGSFLHAVETSLKNVS